MKEEKKSKIITEAITDYQNIMESAQEVAKRKLAEEYSEKFNNLLNEEMFKNKNKAKESDSIDGAQESDNSDDINNNNNSDMNNNVKKQETVKVNHKIGDTAPFNQKPKAVNAVDETVTIQDTVGDNDPFNVNGKKVDETVTIQDTVGDGDPFNKKGKKVDETVTIQDTVGKPNPFTVKGKKSPKIEESFDLSELNVDDEPDGEYEESSDDTFSFNDIEGEIGGIEEDIEGMNGLPRPGSFGKPTKQGGDPYAQLAAMRDQINEILGGIDGETTPEPMDEISNELVANASRGMEGYGQNQRADNLRNNQVDIEILFPTGNYIAGDAKIAGTRMSPDMKRAMIFLKRNDEENGEISLTIQYDSAYDKFQIPPGLEFSRDEARRLGQLASKINPNSQYKSGTKDIPVEGYMEENDEPITDADIDDYFSQQDEEPVEESLGVSHAVNKISTAHIPGASYASSPAAAERRRPAFTNENKKLAGLMEENKKLTKKLNEMKKQKEANNKLMESHRDILNKYRNQLKEMAVFNTNLANVNSILVNESLNLTHEEKVKVINEFKKVNSINESQEKYKTLVREITNTKKSITESVEKFVSTSIQPSASETINEAIETTVYSKDSGIQRMKRLIEYNDKK